MIEYRVTLSRKPTIRVWRVESKRKKQLAEVSKKKAELVKEILLRDIPLKTIMRFRDGRLIAETDEDNAVKLLIGLRAVIGLRDWRKIPKVLEAVSGMDRGEIYWWHSLYLKLGARAIRALRTAYL
jgi:hypothetical protein